MVSAGRAGEAGRAGLGLASLSDASGPPHFLPRGTRAGGSPSVCESPSLEVRRGSRGVTGSRLKSLLLGKLCPTSRT